MAVQPKTRQFMLCGPRPRFYIMLIP